MIRDSVEAYEDCYHERLNEFHNGIDFLEYQFDRDATKIIDTEIESWVLIREEKQQLLGEFEKKHVRRRRLNATSLFNSELVATNIADFLYSPREVRNFALAIQVDGTVWPFLNDYMCGLIGVSVVVQRRRGSLLSCRNLHSAIKSNARLPMDLTREAMDLLDEWCRLGTTEMRYTTATSQVLAVRSWELICRGISINDVAWFRHYMSSGSKFPSSVGAYC